MVKETLASLKKIVQGTPIRVTMANDYTDNVKIISPEGRVYYHQLGSNVASVNATTQLEAMVRLWKKRQEKANERKGVCGYCGYIKCRCKYDEFGMLKGE